MQLSIRGHQVLWAGGMVLRHHGDNCPTLHSSSHCSSLPVGMGHPANPVLPSLEQSLI